MISTVTVIHRLRNVVSMASWNSRPATTIGMVPMMMYQPSAASLSRVPNRSFQSPVTGRVNRQRNQCDRMRAISRRKYNSTASSVPS